MTELDVDQSTVEQFVHQALGVLIGGATAQMVYLGDRLGLYRGLADTGPTSVVELAAETGCAPRYLAEWLAQQASVGFVSYDPVSDRFSLPAAHAAVLATDDSPAALAGAFETLTGWHARIDEVADAFGSGAGIPWAASDERVFRGVTRFFGAAYRAHLVQEWIPALGVEQVLRQGACVADVGCGQGLSTVLMAQAFPHSRFVGIDPHEAAIDEARHRASDAGVSDRAQFVVADAAHLDGGPYDVIWFFDCLHDLGAPIEAAARAHSRLAAQGTVALVEPFAHDDLTANLTTNPGAGLHYTASTFLCLPQSLSEPGRAGLGGQAGHRRIADVLGAAGLTQVERVAATPIHAVYAVHP